MVENCGDTFVLLLYISRTQFDVNEMLPVKLFSLRSIHEHTKRRRQMKNRLRDFLEPGVEQIDAGHRIATKIAENQRNSGLIQINVNCDCGGGIRGEG